MACPLYCILSAGTVHCVPVSAFTVQDTKLARRPEISAAGSGQPKKPLPSLVKTRNLLYSLNNPSLSDLESERPMSEHADDEGDGGHVSSEEEAPKKPLFGRLVDRKRPELAGAADSDSEPAVPEMPIGAADLGPQPDIQAILNDYSTHAVYLPQYSVDLQGNLESDFSQIRSVLPRIFPAWQAPVQIKQLTGGITNMLLSCTHTPDSSCDSIAPCTPETLLMRVYGKGTNLIIDRNREFVSHLILNSLKLAPPIHARFSNGLIYGFLPGRSLEPDELSSPRLYPLIAQQLGHWHNKINAEFIEDGILRIRSHSGHRNPAKSINNLWDLMEDWIAIVPVNEALVANFAANSPGKAVTAHNVRHVILDELRWARQRLRAARSEVVVCHCDLLSGNIIVPEDGAVYAGRLPQVEDNPIQFIDYEYMIPAPRAFDIANHFAEWQGFDCNREAIPEPSPQNPVMVNWCRGYLNDENAPPEKVNALIEEISLFYGLPGFYWGVWAMIQSELSIIDFNYAEYSLLRMEEYWMWKRAL